MGQDSNRANTNVTELVGLGAIIVSLIFVGLEVRQNTIATRAAAYQQHGEHVSNQWMTYALDEDMVRLFSVDERDWDQLTDIEKGRITFAWVGTLRSYETILLQVEEGLLDEDALEKLGWGDAFTPGYQVRMLWPDIAAYLNPQVRDHLEKRYPYLKGPSTGTGEQ